MAYLDAFVIPVKRDKVAEYEAFAEKALKFWTEEGCLYYVDAIEDDVAKGEVTSYPRSVRAADDEVVAVGFAVWPDKASRDAANAKMMAAPPPDDPIPFDGKRMFWGGFNPIIEWKATS